MVPLICLQNERRPVFCFNLKLLRKWNPFAPGKFAPKTHLKARRTILQSQMIKTPFIGRALYDLLVPSVPDAKYQPPQFEHAQKANFRDY